jgi:hypothetical protein
MDFGERLGVLGDDVGERDDFTLASLAVAERMLM